MDEAVGEATGDVDVHFQLAPGEAVFDNETFSVKTNFSKGWNVAVEALPQKGMKLEEEEGWVSFVYTKKEPRPAFRYRIRKNERDQNIRFITIVTPYQNVRPSVKVKVSSRSKIGGDHLNLKVMTDDFSKRIKCDWRN